MAVVGLRLPGQPVIERNFHPPKKATLLAWYRAAQKALGKTRVPEPTDQVLSRADVSSETILFGHPDQAWSLMISRKKWLR